MGANLKLLQWPVDLGIYTCCFLEAEHLIAWPNGFYAGINDQPITHQ